MPYLLSPRAKADIEDIWEYTVQRWGAEQAELYVRQIERALKILVADPNLDRSCDDIRAGYFKYPAGSHLLFYRMMSGDIEIVRILYQRMDFDRHL